MQYLTYEEYQEIGGVLDLTAFRRHIDRVCGFLDNHTFNRLQGSSRLSERVKACTRDCVEYLAENVSGKVVTTKSQSAGGVSESESYATKTLDELNAEMLNIVYDYLASETDDCGVPLLYRGALR